ncbi:MAG: serine acetyltransferase [Rhodospirillaceae bacterium]|nr:MAG: serine acetyltransferase [Rhodospirillaceae bacterium]
MNRIVSADKPLDRSPEEWRPEDQSATAWSLNDIVSELRHSRESANKIRHRGEVRELPSRAAVGGIVDDLAAALFPTHYGRPDLSDDSIDFFVGDRLHNGLAALNEQVRRSLSLGREACHKAETLTATEAVQCAGEITAAFARQLPAIRALLVSDLMAAYNGDPAATSISELLLCYPGITAIIHHRLAHALQRLDAPFIARLIASISQSATGIDIHPAAQIDAGFFIDHGTGVVIGETAIIGRNVRLYQAVTLGARKLPADETGALVKGGARHPIIEDNVVIYAGATVLGRITIGRDSVIGGNVWLTQSVPPGSIITRAKSSHGDMHLISLGLQDGSGI